MNMLTLSISTRFWKVFLPIAFFILFFLSCNQQNKSALVTAKPIAPKEVVNVKWMGHWKNEGFKEKLLFNVARQFEFENQDITLEIKFNSEIHPNVPDGDFVYGQLLKPQPDWDVLLINDDFSVVERLSGDPLWVQKYLVDFSEFEQFRNNSFDYVFSDEMKKRWGGIVPGFSMETNFVMWANKKVAQQLGITLKQSDITFDDIESYFKAVNAYNLKNNSTIRAISLYTGWSPAGAFAKQLFASLIGDYETLKNKKFSEEKIIAWESVLKATEKLSAYNPVDPQWRNNRYGGDYAKSLEGKYLFVVDGPWMYNIWKEMDSVTYQDMIPLELPAMKPAKTYIGDLSVTWVVPKNALHKEEAIRLMLFWCQAEIADNWSRNTKSPSWVKKSIIQSGLGVDMYESFDYIIAKNYQGKKIPLNYGNNSEIFGERNSTIPNYFEEVLEGSLTAAAAISKIRNKLIRY